MRTTLTFLLLSLMLGETRGGETRTDAGDLSRLQGRWTARAGARRELDVVLDVEGKAIKVLIRTPQGLDIKVRGVVKLNEATSPRSLDWIELAGPNRQPLPQVAGIYRLDASSFTVCNGGFLGARPTEFKSGDGALADVIVFQKAEAAATSPAPASGDPGTKVSQADRPDVSRK